MIRILADIVRRLYEVMFGESPRTTNYDLLKSQGIRCVTAGDPAQSVGFIDADEIDLPDSVWYDGKKVDPRSYVLFLVEGTSMVPRGVWSEDILVCNPVEKSSKGSYVIVSVDPDYYNWKKKEVKFEFKLRHSLTEISSDCDLQTVIRKLDEVNPDICLEENQECLKEKYDDIRKYLSDRGIKSKMLTVSETFRKGRLRYSFHPTDLISYRAEFILRRSSNGWKAVKLEEE